MLDLAHERDDVALGPAAEAVVEALLLVDRERRGLLGVEGAQTLPAPADPLQLDVVADHRDEVGRLPNPDHVLVDDPHPRDGTRPTWPSGR